jgi:aspartate racemase
MNSNTWENRKENEVIGIVGGFGSYATLNFFKRILDSYPAEKEWDRPRILIDNYCTLPSRVRGILYGENVDKIIDGLSNSVNSLINAGATKIIISCNTAHYFLDDVYLKVPECKGIIINIIEELAIYLNKHEVSEISLIATEGTLESELYQKTFDEYNIKINAPDRNDFSKMSELIEVVKQNKPIDSQVKSQFIDLLKKQKNKSVILGCTEFPVIYNEVKQDLEKLDITIYDPLEIAILKIKDKNQL